MEKYQLRQAFSGMHITAELQQRLIENCTRSVAAEAKAKAKAYRPARRWLALAASLTIFMACFSQTTYGSSFYEKFVGVVLGGHAYYLTGPVPANDVPDPGLTKDSSEENHTDSSRPGFTDLAEAQAYLDFELKLPDYLPEGYQLDRISLYTTNNDAISGEYADIFFTKGKRFIYLQTRLMNGKTSFAAKLGNMKLTEINGYSALQGRKNLDVDINGVMYMFSASKADVGADELIKMVESID